MTILVASKTKLIADTMGTCRNGETVQVSKIEKIPRLKMLIGGTGHASTFEIVLDSLQDVPDGLTPREIRATVLKLINMEPEDSTIVMVFEDGVFDWSIGSNHIAPCFKEKSDLLFYGSAYEVVKGAYDVLGGDVIDIIKKVSINRWDINDIVEVVEL